MKLKRPVSFLFVALFAGIASNISAQTSPWPFPPRGGSSNQTLRPSGATVTVAFWNIQWFPGRQPDSSLSGQTSQINSVHADMNQLRAADVVGMEEVRDFTQAGVAVQPLRGFKVDVCANFPPREGQNVAQETAIASRFTALSAWAEEWKHAEPVTPPRGFSFAAYEVAPRQLLMVYALHLKSNRGDIHENVSMRQESMRQLRSHIDAMEKAYANLGTLSWIVGGDFNTSFEDRQYASETTLRSLIEGGFAWCWQNVPASTRVTLPPSGAFPPACFDHIFYRGATLKRAWVVPTLPQSSDHRAVAATFDLPAPK
jgi:endonuclease/exonuclease/phosphatase (EEP) superfamily protein YafD